MSIHEFPTPAVDGSQSVEAAVDHYLDSVHTKTTRARYANTLVRLTALAGDRPAATLTPEDYAAVMDKWNSAASATWNRHLSALTSSGRVQLPGGGGVERGHRPGQLSVGTQALQLVRVDV
ncbi:hypothetical protein SAMN05421505_13458 [Sinosporangium album]|uniref:Core-binding (CB) domain-containing protein n=1 Tax=Sinosporangium album TaxID=504805 RepID=A0A1G8HYE4_9ACTN|nr:hypothetical protein [Sinosporangium album]SDI11735.1 hypothetical protein SAMN05421505_13458 [Sinosporangium album]